MSGRVRGAAVADTVTQPDVARPRHIRVARSPRRQQTTEGLLEQRFALAVDQGHIVRLSAGDLPGAGAARVARQNEDR